MELGRVDELQGRSHGRGGGCGCGRRRGGHLLGDRGWLGNRRGLRNWGCLGERGLLRHGRRLR